MSNKTVRNGGHDRDRTCDPYHVKALAVAPALRSLEHLQLVSEHYVFDGYGRKWSVFAFAWDQFGTSSMQTLTTLSATLQPVQVDGRSRRTGSRGLRPCKPCHDRQAGAGQPDHHEANFGDGMYTQLFNPVIRKVHPCVVEEVKHSIQKERRIIDTLEPVMNRHKLIFDRQIILNDYRSAQAYDGDSRITKTLIHQMTRISYEKGSLKHDDRLDALAIAVAYHARAWRRTWSGASTMRSRPAGAELER